MGYDDTKIKWFTPYRYVLLAISYFYSGWLIQVHSLINFILANIISCYSTSLNCSWKTFA